MGTARRSSSASGSGPPGPARTARAVAVRVVRRVADEGAYSALTLAAELGRSPLDRRDRDLASDLAYGTIRRLLLIDHVLSAASSRPVGTLDPEVRAALRVAVYQILFTRIPAHAAVSESVALAPVRGRGFANAVLRRVAANPPSPPAGHGDGAISLRTGLSEWAVAELGRLLPAGEVEAAAASLASPAGLTLRANACRTTGEHLERELRAAGHEPTKGRHHPDVLKLARGSPPRLPGFAEGWFAVQDEASVLVAAALAARPGEVVYDACAGPGGKAAHLACAVAPGGVVVAADARHGRAALVREAARRLGVRVLVVTGDARRPPVREAFDAVLVDAPCSGLGSARRRPELLWRPRRSDLSSLARLQVAILVGAASVVRPGGRLLYSVCTFPRAETDAALRAFRSHAPAFEPLEVPGPDGPATTHRLWPHRHGTDAMFYAAFRRGRGSH